MLTHTVYMYIVCTLTDHKLIIFKTFYFLEGKGPLLTPLALETLGFGKALTSLHGLGRVNTATRTPHVPQRFVLIGKMYLP